MVDLGHKLHRSGLRLHFADNERVGSVGHLYFGCACDGSRNGYGNCDFGCGSFGRRNGDCDFGRACSADDEHLVSLFACGGLGRLRSTSNCRGLIGQRRRSLDEF